MTLTGFCCSYPSFEPGDVVCPVVTVGRVEGVVLQLGEADDDLVDLLVRQQDRPLKEKHLVYNSV